MLYQVSLHLVSQQQNKYSGNVVTGNSLRPLIYESSCPNKSVSLPQKLKFYVPQL